MPKVFSLPIFTKEFRRSVPSVILWFLISGGLLVLIGILMATGTLGRLIALLS